MTLGLDRQPAAEVIVDGTVPTWINTLTTGRQFEEDRDAPRFRAAFVTLAGTCRAWPVPRDFLEALPRIETVQQPKAIDGPHSREVGMRTLAELADKLKIDPVKPHTEVDA